MWKYEDKQVLYNVHKMIEAFSIANPTEQMTETNENVLTAVGVVLLDCVGEDYSGEYSENAFTNMAREYLRENSKVLFEKSDYFDTNYQNVPEGYLLDNVKSYIDDMINDIEKEVETKESETKESGDEEKVAPDSNQEKNTVEEDDISAYFVEAENQYSTEPQTSFRFIVDKDAGDIKKLRNQMMVVCNLEMFNDREKPEENFESNLLNHVLELCDYYGYKFQFNDNISNAEALDGVFDLFGISEQDIMEKGEIGELSKEEADAVYSKDEIEYYDWDRSADERKELERIRAQQELEDEARMLEELKRKSQEEFEDYKEKYEEWLREMELQKEREEIERRQQEERKRQQEIDRIRELEEQQEYEARIERERKEAEDLKAKNIAEAMQRRKIIEDKQIEKNMRDLKAIRAREQREEAERERIKNMLELRKKEKEREEAERLQRQKDEEARKKALEEIKNKIEDYKPQYIEPEPQAENEFESGGGIVLGDYFNDDDFDNEDDIEINNDKKPESVDKEEEQEEPVKEEQEEPVKEKQEESVKEEKQEEPVKEEQEEPVKEKQEESVKEEKIEEAVKEEKIEEPVKEEKQEEEPVKEKQEEPVKEKQEEESVKEEKQEEEPVKEEKIEEEPVDEEIISDEKQSKDVSEVKHSNEVIEQTSSEKSDSKLIRENVSLNELLKEEGKKISTDKKTSVVDKSLSLKEKVIQFAKDFDSVSSEKLFGNSKEFNALRDAVKDACNSAKKPGVDNKEFMEKVNILRENADRYLKAKGTRKRLTGLGEQRYELAKKAKELGAEKQNTLS